jgi:superoxide reductase
MIEKDQIYKCEVCGNKVKIIEIGGGQLKCCGAEMQLADTNTESE